MRHRLIAGCQAASSEVEPTSETARSRGNQAPKSWSMPMASPIKKVWLAKDLTLKADLD